MGDATLLPFVYQYFYIYFPILISLIFFLSLFEIDKKIANICGINGIMSDKEFVQEMYDDGLKLYLQGILSLFL